MTAVDRSQTARADQVDLSTTLGPVELANPIVTASGCFASGKEMNRFYDVNRLGAVIAKSVTLEPRQGMPTPRMAETASGMLNAVGLQNQGIERWLADDEPWLTEQGVPTIVSIAGERVADYRQLAERLRGIDTVLAIEANISCPNVEADDTVFATSPQGTHDVISQVTRVADVPVFAKLTPDVTDVTEIARVAWRAGATGVSAINTLRGMAIDVETCRPKLGGVTGGLSGPAIKPVAIRAVHQLHQALPDLPIIGIGGVSKVEDIVEFLLAGASAVAVGTSNFVNPLAASDLLDGLPQWLAARGYTGLDELRGALRL